MSTIRNLLIGNPYDLTKGLDALEDRAIDACMIEAEGMNLDASVAIRNLDEFDAHVPDPTEVALRLNKNEVGDWQAVLRVTATMATRAALEAEVDADLAKIKAAIHEAEMGGYSARKLYGSNPNDWAPHYTESDWFNGTLIEWCFRDGTFDAALLEVNLTGFADIWIDLALVD